MIRNYLKVAWRNLVKNKTFSIINIVGLASGLACFILIALYVTDELSYDKFNEKIDRIYRINSDIEFGGNKLHMTVTPDPMAAALKQDYPQVESYCRIYASGGSKLLKKGNTFINEAKVAHADSTFFDLFTLPAIYGDTKTALDEPNSVVITESTAIKYFSSTDVIGNFIETNDNSKTLYKVTAVIKDIPRNAHFDFDFIFSMENVDYDWGQFLSNNFHTYLLLKPGTDYQEFEKNFIPFIDKYVLPQAQQFMNVKSMDEMRANGNKLEYSLMPVKDIHLYSDRFPELAVNGNIQYVYIFSAVALFILLLACVNFMNLSTARSSGRAKEVGIRKVMGSEKKSLIAQFITESVLLAYISLGFSIIIVVGILSYFNDLSGKSFVVSDLFSPVNFLVWLLLPVFVGFLAGSYPAFYLSSFKPISVLKGKMNADFKKSNLRNLLVVFQFATSIFLMVATIVVYRQLNFIQNKELGYHKDQVLVVNNTNALGKSAAAFKEEVSGFAGVSSATFAGYLPVSNSSRSDYAFSKEAVMDTKNSLSTQVWGIDFDYINTLDMEILKGRNFSKEFISDSSGIIINETTAKVLGYENPVGEKIYSFFSSPGQSELKAFTIIGVVKNFHFESLKQTVGPLIFVLGDRTGATAFKINAGDIPDIIKKVESKWVAMSPGLPFSYEFLDESFNNMYREEQRTAKLGLTFAIIAILIACLGLFGLSAYMADQRTKEIGIRKVLGATVSNITNMLTRDFLKLVLWAAVLGCPLAFWAMNNWLQDFAFRINIAWWIFGIAGLITLLIALGTVGFQAIKSAMANPVKSLRAE